MIAFPLTKVPLTISGLLCWLDASVTSSVISSGGLVSQWSDISGRGYNFTQGTGANQPTVSGNTLVFNGTSTYLKNTSITSKLYVSKSMTCYVVFTYANESANDHTIFYSSDPASSIRAWTIQGYNAALRYGYYGPITDTTISRGINTTTTYDVSITRDSSGPTNTGYLNMLSFTGTAGVTLSGYTSDYTNIGSRNGITGFHQGTISEIILYERPLSSTENIIVERYLGNKWASSTL